MERTRPVPPAQDAALDTVEPLPGLVPLPALVEAVRSPGVMREDVDALLQGLARPVAEGESPRARADLLLSLIDAPDVRDMRGRNGRTVRRAAVEALLNLGYPYALEVPPEALAGTRPPGRSGARDYPVGGLILSALTLTVQTAVGVPLSLMLMNQSDPTQVLGGVLVLVLAIAPISSALLGGLLRWRTLQRVGVVLMGLMGAGSALYALELLGSKRSLDALLGVLLMGLGLIHGLCAFLLRRPEWLPADTDSADEAS